MQYQGYFQDSGFNTDFTAHMISNFSSCHFFHAASSPRAYIINMNCDIRNLVRARGMSPITYSYLQINTLYYRRVC